MTTLGVRVSRGMKKWADETVGEGEQVTAGVKVAAEIALWGRKITIRGSLPVHDGQVGSGASLVLDGVEELTIGVTGGSANGLPDNTTVRAEVPVDVFIQVPPSPETAGLPMVLQAKYKFFLRRVGQRLAAAASRHHHWLGTPEENAAVGTAMP